MCSQHRCAILVTQFSTTLWTLRGCTVVLNATQYSDLVLVNLSSLEQPALTRDNSYARTIGACSEFTYRLTNSILTLCKYIHNCEYCWQNWLSVTFTFSLPTSSPLPHVSLFLQPILLVKLPDLELCIINKRTTDV